MSLSRRDVLKRGGVLGAGAAAFTLPTGALSVRAQETKRKVIFVTHDDNPFFVPCQFGFEEFGTMAGWETQWVGPPKHDEAATVQMQLDAIAAQPDAVGFTRTNATMYDEGIRRAQEQGIFVILYNTATPGYKEVASGENELAYVGQEFIPAGIQSGLQAAKHAQELTGRTEGVIVLGTIAPGHSALDQRMEGARQGIAQYNEENGTSFTTEDFTTSTDQAEAIGRIDAKYTEMGDRIVGFAHADYVHWFTGLWIEQKGLQGKLANGGFDLVQGAMEAIKNGTAQWSIGQNPYAQGWVTSALIHMRIEHGFQPFDYDTGAEVIDASNIDRVMEREAKFAG